MELHQLTYVLAVADTASFTGAAARLHVSQSGVSTQVKKLERELGIAFFDRTSRRVALTEEGQRIVPALRAAAAIDAVRAQASDLRGVVVGPLRIGTVTAPGWSDFFDAVAAIHSAYPGVDLRLVESTSSDLIAQVRAGDLDVVIAGWSPDAPAGLETETVFDDALVAAVAPDHAWAARDVIRPGELAGVDLIALPRGTGARDAMDQMLARAGARSVPRWEAASPTSLIALASRGVGVAVASESTVVGTRGLTVLRIADPAARSRLGVAWRARPAPAAQAFLNQLLGRRGSVAL